MRIIFQVAVALLLAVSAAQAQAQAKAKTAPAAKPAAKAAPKAPAQPAAQQAAQPAAEAKPAAAPAPEPGAPAGAVSAGPTWPQLPPADPYAEAKQKMLSDDAAFRRQGVSELAQLRDARTAPDLLAALEDKAPAVRRAAIDGLGLLPWRPAAKKVAELLQKDPHPAVRQQAAIALAYIGDADSGPALVKALDDASEPVRYAAINTIGSLRYKPAEARLASMLEKGDVNTTRSAISALGLLQSAAAVPAILPALRSENPLLRSEAARALGDIGQKTVTRDLADRLVPAEQPQVRLEASFALAKLGDGAGLAAAREYLSSADLPLKNLALQTVSLLGDAESLPAIKKMLAEENNPAAVGMLDLARQQLEAAAARPKK